MPFQFKAFKNAQDKQETYPGDQERSVVGKLIELEEKERLIEADKIEAVAGSLGLGTYSSLHAFEFKPLEKFGLCSSCMALSYARRKYAVAKAWCSELEIGLRDNDPIVECTEFEKRFSLSLSAMKDMALLINLEKTNPTGFITEE